MDLVERDFLFNLREPGSAAAGLCLYEAPLIYGFRRTKQNPMKVSKR